MRLYQRSIALLLVLILTLSALLVGCDDRADLPLDTSDPSQSTPSDTVSGSSGSNIASSELVLVENGECRYQLIRYEDSSDAAVEALRIIRDAIQQLTGCTPTVNTDFKKKNAEYDPDTLAILIGSTRYDETAQVSAGMGYGEYRVQVCGNKLVVAAPMDDCVTAAAEALASALPSCWDGERLVIPADFNLAKVVNKLVNDIPVCIDGNVSGIYDAGNDSRLLLITQSSAEQYSDYCTTVLASGYETYAENEINGMLFSSYVSDSVVLNVVFCKPTRELRVSADLLSNTALPPREQDNSYTVTCSSSVTQLGCEFNPNGGSDVSGYQIGMCYIFRLADAALSSRTAARTTSCFPTVSTTSWSS